MNIKAKKYLFDILDAGRDIQNFTSGVSDLSSYREHRMMNRAVERMLEIIGEATNRFEKEVSVEMFSNARQIVGLRNRLAHTYDDINEALIWDVIQNYIPVLIREIEAILKNDLENLS